MAPEPPARRAGGSRRHWTTKPVPGQSAQRVGCNHIRYSAFHEDGFRVGLVQNELNRDTTLNLTQRHQLHLCLESRLYVDPKKRHESGLIETQPDPAGALPGLSLA